MRELAHSTLSPKRLDRREALCKRWGDEAYAAEELRAELASAIMSAELGIEMSEAQREKHTAKRNPQDWFVVPRCIRNFRRMNVRWQGRAEHRCPVLALFEHRIAEHEEVMECYLMTGESDYLIRVAVADIAALEELIPE